MQHRTSDIVLSDTTPYVDVSLEAKRVGIQYPVLIDGRIKKLLEEDFKIEGLEWSSPQEPLSMYIIAPLQFLLCRFPAELKYRFSVRPKSSDLASSGIPVIASFVKDQAHRYHILVQLDAWH